MNYKRIQQRVKRPTEIPFLNAIIFHAALGVGIYAIRPLSLIYMLGILTFFIIKIIRKPQDPVIVLEGAAYIMAAEVFLRMTGGFVFYETGKYAVILFMLFGMFFHGFKTKALIYVVYLLLLLPAVYITFQDLPYDMNFRKNILFNISGPLSLTFAALFCYDLKVSIRRFLDVLDYMLLPIIAMTLYLFFYSPDLQDVVTGADANFAASGGFGPNQVSTVLGIGMFVLLIRIFIPYKNRLVQLLGYVLLPLITFRALATLSRGGVFTAILMLLFFLFVYFMFTSGQRKARGIIKIGLLFGGGFLIWLGAVIATNGMVFNKYTNRNASGVKQESATSGRDELAEAELSTFLNNPVFGVGVGMGKIKRLEYTGRVAATHNEISRVIGEHGLLGIFSFLILLVVPGIKFLKNPRNLFMIPLIVFWGATINHSSMRIAAPGLMYGLAMLNIQYPSVRQRAKQRVQHYKKKYHGYKAALSR